MFRNRLPSTLAAATLVLALSTAALDSPAVAGEGAIEINQLCVATGCFDGDSPGWPVRITEPGSYVLTSNLDVPSSSEGVEIQASQVVLDLGGHAIRSGHVCTGDGPTCSGAAGIRGIGFGVMNFPSSITIRNGTVQGFEFECMRVSGAGVVVRDLQVSDCGANGIIHFGQGLIEDTVVRNAGATGITGNGLVTVRNSYLLNNFSYGVQDANCSGNTLWSNATNLAITEENCANDIDISICSGAPCP
ncbi:hypothetical protein [Halomonas denitrificans]|nr:hypothetical protein [Halomonas denitrificans]